jgi:hypothetical protein
VCKPWNTVDSTRTNSPGIGCIPNSTGRSPEKKRALDVEPVTLHGRVAAHGQRDEIAVRSGECVRAPREARNAAEEREEIATSPKKERARLRLGDLEPQGRCSERSN